MYHSAIGSLLYFIASRLDILFIMDICAKYQSCIKESHLCVIKQILGYLKGIQDVGLWYPKTETFDLIRYSYSDYAGYKLDRKNNNGKYQFLGPSLAIVGQVENNIT